ncbi:hypothetical protein BDZ89DRAFT_1013764 [Hymenopellis radicata]|nr:hypothetical protein BDZ89DRAFT_1013764 [Hymenopellis radicata]
MTDDPLPAPLTDRNLSARQQSSTASRLARRSASAKPNSPAGPFNADQNPRLPSESVVVEEIPPLIDESHSTEGPSNGLSAFACPICFSPPTNATLTPCGHVSCGACLFNAVAIALRTAEDRTPRCPVCRAHIAGWDGKGGGVIGLRPRVQYTWGEVGR